jgi:hypothetical protein
MGLFKWFKNKTYPPALVADNAVKQYQKAKYRNLGDTPAEIAQVMWGWRYLNAKLDAKSQWRFQHYLETDFPIETIMDFCLGSFDIEFLFGPPDLDTYDYAANHIGKELAKNGVPCTTRDIHSFIDKWNRLIHHLR